MLQAPDLWSRIIGSFDHVFFWDFLTEKNDKQGSRT